MMILIFTLVVVVIVLYWLFLSPYSQFFGRFVWRGDTSQKRLALSFDDGPNEPFTSQIAQYLRDEGVRATFFLVGANIDRFEDTAIKLTQLGHTVANHSYHHQFRKYFTSKDFGSEIISTQQRVTQATGKTPALFRPPWLFRIPIILTRANKEGLTPISGEFCHVFEIFQPNARRIAARALAKVKPGAIIIFHDGFNARTADRTQTVAAIKLLVPKLKQLGYSLVTVEELLSLKPYQTNKQK